MNRRRAWPWAACALVVPLALAGCGQQARDSFALAAADQAALETCRDAVGGVAVARTAVAAAAHDTAGADDVGGVTAAARSLQVMADRAEDDLLGQTLQELVDSLTAFAAVAPDPGLSGFADVAADVNGRLSGFARTCPVADPGFEHGSKGWKPLSVTAVSGHVAGRRGAAARLSNRGEGPATLGARAPAGWVPRASGSAYRVGIWARAETGTPTLTLRVTETSGDRLLGEGARSVQLGQDWTLLALRYPTSGERGSLTIEVSADDVPAGAGVLLDDVEVARG